MGASFDYADYPLGQQLQLVPNGSGIHSLQIAAECAYTTWCLMMLSTVFSQFNFLQLDCFALAVLQILVDALSVAIRTRIFCVLIGRFRLRCINPDLTHGIPNSTYQIDGHSDQGQWPLSPGVVKQQHALDEANHRSDAANNHGQCGTASPGFNRRGHLHRFQTEPKEHD